MKAVTHIIEVGCIFKVQDLLDFAQLIRASGGKVAFYYENKLFWYVFIEDDKMMDDTRNYAMKVVTYIPKCYYIPEPHYARYLTLNMDGDGEKAVYTSSVAHLNPTCVIDILKTPDTVVIAIAKKLNGDALLTFS